MTARIGTERQAVDSTFRESKRTLFGASLRARSGSTKTLMDTLRAEHAHMGSVMRVFSDQLDAIAKGELVDPHLVYEIMDYMVQWPDRFHHPREDLIYARVAELDAEAADAVDTLQRDHDNTAKQGQALLGDIERWRNGELEGERLVEIGRKYVAHIYEHMNVEEAAVFPHIESVLSMEDWRELEAEDQLAGIVAPVFGPAVQRNFRNLARKLRRGVRRTVERQALAEWIGVEALAEAVDAVALAAEASRHSALEHARTALGEAVDLVLEDPLVAPLKVASNNTRLTLEYLEDIAEISRDTITDLAKINRERRDRARLLARAAPRP